MTIYTWLLFGLMVGLCANVFQQKHSFSGVAATTTVGIAGALLGGMTAFLLFGTFFIRVDLTAFFLALLVAINAFFLFRLKNLF